MSRSPASQERSLVVGLAIAAGAAALLVSAPTWVSATLRDDGLPEVALSVNGRTLAPLVAGAGLLALAGGLAALLAGPIVRRVIGALLLVVGAGAAWSVLSLLRHPKTAVEGPLGDAVGLTQVSATTANVSAWPTIAALVCTLIAVAGGWMLLRAGSWSTSARRFDRGRTDAPAGPRPAGESEPGDAAGDEAEPMPPADPDGTGLWDALDRGEDPTL